jgi:hypothetical protein
MTLPLETTPKALSPKIFDFCRSIAAAGQPIFVPAQPFDGAQRGECFENVARYAAQFGGSSVTGWCIWERPRVNLRAESYAVWKAPNGQLCDVSPKPNGESQILFLADPKPVSEGNRTENRFWPLMHWREIQDYLAANARFQSMTMVQSGIHGIDPTEYASAAAELKRAVKALQRRLGRP